MLLRKLLVCPWIRSCQRFPGVWRSYSRIVKISSNSVPLYSVYVRVSPPTVILYSFLFESRTYAQAIFKAKEVRLSPISIKNEDCPTRGVDAVPGLAISMVWLITGRKIKKGFNVPGVLDVTPNG